MKYDRLKHLLEVCSIEELDSLDILLSNVKKYDLYSINKVYRNVLNEKWKNNSSDYEGINEYDFITRVSNFDIRPIVEYANNPYELIFFKKLMVDAIINISNSNNKLYFKTIPNILESLEKVNFYLDGFDNINNIITDEELKNMLNKFDAIELEELNIIYEFMDEYNIESMMDITNELIYKKSETVYKEFGVFIKPYNFNISSLSNKKELLSDKELQFLRTILNDCIFGLMNYKEEYDLENCLEYDKLSSLLFNLLESIEEELNNRNNNLVLKNNYLI